MVIQTANIISGFLLAAPHLKKVLKNESVVNNISSAEKTLDQWKTFIGIAEIILGTISLVQSIRYSIIFPSFYYYGASGYAQAIIAIIMGLLLASHLFDNVSFLKKIRL